ncbi:hypothetical protein Save01_09093 [Streptomyces avermitilis]
MGTAAACSYDQPSGIGARKRWSHTATGPNESEHSPSTRSPTATLPTPAPVSRTVPATSPPMPFCPSTMPSATTTSRKFSPTAWTAIRTWPGPSGSRTSGQGTSATFSIVPRPVLSSRHGVGPGGGSSAGCAWARASRGAVTVPPRIASRGSAHPSAAANTSRDSAVPSRSTSANRSGCSDTAEVTRPQLAAFPRSVTSSSSPAATAPEDTNTSRAEPNRSSASQARTRSSVSWAAVCAAAAGSPGAPGARQCTTMSGTGPSAAPSSSRSAPTRTPARSPASPNRSAPTSAYDGAGSSTVTVRGVQWRWSSASSSAPPVDRPGAARAAGLVTSDRTETTGRPVSSVSSSASWSPDGVSRTRAAVAPVAYRCTPVQENGSFTPASWSPASTMACSAASSRAGWTP